MTISPLKIGSLSIWPPVMSAPMAGYTGDVYREILREHGCPYCVTEMVSAKGLLHGGDNSEEILYHEMHDRPLAIQLFGYEAESMAKAAELVQSLCHKFEAIDINMGCPARKITSQGSGGALLNNVSLARDIVQAVKSVSRLPVTAKIRTGWSDSSGALEFARALVDAGIDMLVVHGRTVSQGYSGKADWGVIEAVAADVGVPVVGNGDILTASEAVIRLEAGRVSGVMVGRALLGNPLFFDNLSALLNGKEVGVHTAEMKMALAREHFWRSIQRYGERKGLLEMRKQLVFYFRGLRGATRLREMVVNEKSIEKVIELLEEGWRQIE